MDDMASGTTIKKWYDKLSRVPKKPLLSPPRTSGPQLKEANLKSRIQVNPFLPVFPLQRVVILLRKLWPLKHIYIVHKVRQGRWFEYYVYVTARRPTIYLPALIGGYFGFFPQFGKQETTVLKFGLQKKAIDWRAGIKSPPISADGATTR